jgi:predicted nucleic acid-binding protein
MLEGKHLSSDSKPNLGPGDAIVAVTGLTLNEAVVTNDTDFETVEGLRVRLY